MMNDIDSQSMLRVGTILHGTYCIERYLSSGGFGNTYVAVHTEFNERYAVKEFFMKGITQRDGDSITVSVSNAANQSQFAEQKEKFKKEARRLRGLSNPHVVKVYDLFEENGTVYYVMDFIDGESLSERLKRLGTPLSEAEVNQYLPQILDALECVHGQQIWHLDLKPANIMVDKSSVIKLIDFGASKQIRPDGGATTSTALCFTPGYAPSEQIGQNMKKFGPWTDFYALGASIYNMLTMNRPPEPLDISEDGEGAFAFNSNISINLRQLIIWLMQPDRIKRPQNVDEIREKLSIKKSDAPEPTIEAPTEKVNTMGGDATVLNGSTPPDDKTKVLPKDESFAHLLAEAQNGITVAQIAVGNCYYYGKNDVNMDINKALYWWNLAAEKGNAQAQYYIGSYYYNRDNIDEAKVWLGKSANNSYKYAIDLLKQINDKSPDGDSDGDSDEDSSHKVYYWAFFIIVGLIILIAVMGNIGGNQTAAVNADADTVVVDSAASTVHIADNINGDYEYTGPVDNNERPNGNGKAVYADGRIYEGPFVNGVRQGDNAWFQFSDGNVYEGSFVNDEFGTGTLTSHQSDSKGMYFQGTFKNDQPYTGNWYNADGSLYSRLNNGK
jgi:serine/threonine protein kinase